MTLQSSASSGNPLTLNEIKAEFGGPNKITNYYRGGGYVPNHDTNSLIPTSGNINVLDFLSADKAFRCAITAGQQTIYPIGAIIVYTGYSTNLDGVGYSFGSILSGATYCGISGSSLTQATLGGIYSATVYPTGIAGPGGTTYSNVLLLAGGDFTASATWTTLTLTGTGGPVTYNRTSATSTTYYSSGNYTKYTWGGSLGIGGTGTVNVAIS